MAKNPAAAFGVQRVYVFEIVIFFNVAFDFQKTPLSEEGRKAMQ